MCCGVVWCGVFCEDVFVSGDGRCVVPVIFVVWLGVLSRGSACVCYGGMKVVLDGGTRVLFCAVGFVRSLCCVM